MIDLDLFGPKPERPGERRRHCVSYVKEIRGDPRYSHETRTFICARDFVEKQLGTKNRIIVTARVVQTPA